jgi:hypothetical protein
MNDPIRTWRRRVVLTTVASAGAVGAALTWCFLPASRTPMGQPAFNLTAPVRTEDRISTVPAIDARAFASAKLWNPVPPPPQTEIQIAREPPKPPRLQLIGIINEDGVLRAALYDQDDDRLFIVASGERIKNHTITHITSNGIEISDGHTTHELRLELSSS